MSPIVETVIEKYCAQYPELKEKLLAFRKQLAEEAKENGGLGVDL